MTDREKIALINAEVKRLYQDHYGTASTVLHQLHDFINSLPEEPISEDLEEAASKYCEGSSFEDAVMENPAFKAGAQWQKEQFNR